MNKNIIKFAMASVSPKLTTYIMYLHNFKKFSNLHNPQNINGKVYFSELTFIPTGGNMKLKPNNLIDEWGKWLEIK